MTLKSRLLLLFAVLLLVGSGGNTWAARSAEADVCVAKKMKAVGQSVACRLRAEA